MNMTTTIKSAASPKYLTMESLALPQDLYWDGKIEPSSPVFDNAELFPILQPHTDILADAINVEDETVEDIKEIDCETLLASEDCIIEIRDLKTEPWSHNPKLQAPSPTQQYIDFSIGSVVPHPNPVIKVVSPFTADSVFYTDTALTQLTPPQSPPQNGAAAVYQIFNDGNNKETISNINIVDSAIPALFAQHQHQAQQQTSYASWTAPQPPTDFIQDEKIARDIQIFDEIIKNRVKELPEWIDNCETQSSCSAPSQAESVLADDEWLPDSSSCSSSVASSPRHFSIGGGSSSSDDQAIAINNDMAPSSSAGSKTNKKRTRPYGRGVEDRKIRKKEQNKNAATRYRLKKKQEMASVLTEEQELSKRNAELKRILAERNREAKYLKSLIREFYKGEL